MTLGDVVGKVLGEGHGDAVRAMVERMVQLVMELEVGKLAGAGLHERTDERRTHRNGYRDRTWDTRVGTLDLRIPRLRSGSYMPSFLEPRRRSEQALLSVIQEAYVHGVSTRKVEDLVQALGVESLSKSEVSRVCQGLDEEVAAFRDRPLDKAYPYLWLDATVEKVREGKRVVSSAVVVAYGVNSEGYREVLGLEVGAAESHEAWVAFLRGLVARGLHGTQLVISDAHAGLQRAIAEVLTGAAWQRCTVHFMRNVLSRVGKHQQGMVGAAVRTIFSQPDKEAARAQLRRTSDKLARAFPEVSRLLDEGEEDILAYMAFPQAHWRKIRSTNPLERLNREIGRRCSVVGIFPNRQALTRLVGMVLAEQSDEWLVGKRYLSLVSLELLDGNPKEEPMMLVA